VLSDGEHELQGDYVFTGNTIREYTCFKNGASMITEKLIDFGIMAESEPRREAPAKADYISEHTSALEESIFRLNEMLMNVKRTQKWCVRIYSPLAHILIHLSYIFHTRNNRGFSIVWSTQKYAFIWH
ncbi:hypothetical protein F5879DRAFT_764430, partial [Lentinula edodes]|uniref:uncharacterized protein n=1 Tax=Lentinula edodes TaxID=5353 RepID=UPI001E8E9B9A